MSKCGKLKHSSDGTTFLAASAGDPLISAGNFFMKLPDTFSSSVRRSTGAKVYRQIPC